MSRYSPLLFILAIGLVPCVSAADIDAITATLADSGRAAEDRARDADRKPTQVVAFLGVESGMQVVDLIAASGYFTEVMAIAVGASGTVYAQNNQFVLQMREGANEKALTARLSGNRLPNVKRLDREMTQLGLEPNTIDVAFTAQNFHDIYNGQGPEAAQGFLAVVLHILKPGGTLGIVDHVGAAGADNAKLHRIEPAVVIAAATQAGFILAGQSDALHNAADNHTLGVFDPAIRGKTDQFLLKLTKPEKGDS